MTISSFLHGRGLWCGVEKGDAPFTMSAWDTLCKQAHSWGMQVIHPKVGDGAHLWYTPEQMQQMHTIAQDNHLTCVPYLYCYGNTYGALDWEAHNCVEVGAIFGASIADIEIEWQNVGSVVGKQWAERFGEVIRRIEAYRGEVYVTTFANMVDHPLPYAQMNSWCNGFLPQVYFDEWTSPVTHKQMTAQEAISFVYPQWIHVASEIESETKVGMVPLFPIIELGNGLPQHEVQEWISQMHGYTYCGFLYDATVSPYVKTITALPSPDDWVNLSASHSSTSSVSKVPETTVHAATTVSASVVKTEAAPIEVIPDYELPGLAENELQVLWQSATANMVWAPTSAIYRVWHELVHRGVLIGAPTHNEQSATKNGVKIVWMTFTSNHQIIYFPDSGRTCLL